MKKFTKLMALILALVLVAGLLTACGPKEQPAPAKPQGGENQPKSGSGQHRRRHRPHHRKKPSGGGTQQ